MYSQYFITSYRPMQAARISSLKILFHNLTQTYTPHIPFTRTHRIDHEGTTQHFQRRPTPLEYLLLGVPAPGGAAFHFHPQYLAIPQFAI